MCIHPCVPMSAWRETATRRVKASNTKPRSFLPNQPGNDMKPLTAISRFDSFGSMQVFRHCGCLLVLCLAIVGWANPARSQDVASGKLASVKVTGSARYKSELLVPETGLSPGTTVTKADLQNGADRLARCGLFTNVNYRFFDTDAGVGAEYQVTDGPTLPVWFDNFPWFTDEELSAALKKDVPLFDGTAPGGGSVLREMASALERLLATRGVNSAVSAAQMTTPVTERHVEQFHADNAALNIGAMEFSDALAKNDRGLQQRLGDVIGQPYSRNLVALFEFEQVRPVYFANAYLRAKFGEPVAKVTGEGASARVTITAPIDPGPQFAWAGVVWSGNTTETSAMLNPIVTLKNGDAADGMKVEALWDAVRDEYTRSGFLDMTLTPVPQFDDFAKKVSYNVAINEGPQFRMGKLVLTGLSIEGEKRIRAAWGIAPGAVFNKEIYEKFFATGIKEAFVGLPFHYEKVGRFVQEDTDHKTVDVMFDFQ
jgi:outer membrane protein assembly factor BamA